MKWIEILRKDDYALLQSESDTQYMDFLQIGGKANERYRQSS